MSTKRPPLRLDPPRVAVVATRRSVRGSALTTFGVRLLVVVGSCVVGAVLAAVYLIGSPS